MVHVMLAPTSDVLTLLYIYVFFHSTRINNPHIICFRFQPQAKALEFLRERAATAKKEEKENISPRKENNNSNSATPRGQQQPHFSSAIPEIFHPTTPSDGGQSSSSFSVTTPGTETSTSPLFHTPEAVAVAKKTKHTSLSTLVAVPAVTRELSRGRFVVADKKLESLDRPGSQQRRGVVADSINPKIARVGRGLVRGDSVGYVAVVGSRGMKVVVKKADLAASSSTAPTMMNMNNSSAESADVSSPSRGVVIVSSGGSALSSSSSSTAAVSPPPLPPPPPSATTNTVRTTTISAMPLSSWSGGNRGAGGVNMPLAGVAWSGGHESGEEEGERTRQQRLEEQERKERERMGVRSENLRRAREFNR